MVQYYANEKQQWRGVKLYGKIEKIYYVNSSEAIINIPYVFITED